MAASNGRRGLEAGVAPCPDFAATEMSAVGVKPGNTRCEQMFSAVAQERTLRG